MTPPDQIYHLFLLRSAVFGMGLWATVNNPIIENNVAAFSPRPRFLDVVRFITPFLIWGGWGTVSFP